MRHSIGARLSRSVAKTKEIDPKHVLASQFITHVYWKIGEVNSFAAWIVSQAIAWGFSEDMQQVYATAGLSGVRRFMVLF